MARKYVAKEQAPAAVTDPAAPLPAELKAQRKQFNLIMKQNADLLTAIAKNGGGGGGGNGDGGRGCGCDGGGQKTFPDGPLSQLQQNGDPQTGGLLLL